MDRKESTVLLRFRGRKRGRDDVWKRKGANREGGEGSKRLILKWKIELDLLEVMGPT